MSDATLVFAAESDGRETSSSIGLWLSRAVSTASPSEDRICPSSSLPEGLSAKAGAGTCLSRDASQASGDWPW